MIKKYIYDLETYPNFFLAVFKEVNQDNWLIFEISDRKNQTEELRKFALSNINLIGFNNLNFDYPVLHKTILSNNNRWNSFEIYNIVEEIINSKYSSIWDNQIKIPQLDLYKIWHYDNKNKSTSLKWLQFAMRMKNIEDLPYKVGSILTSEQMDSIISYCNNDIIATEKFFFKSLKQIEIRQHYVQKEGLNVINASETKISKEIFGKYLSKELDISIKELKTLRTYRSKVEIKDVIFPYIKFNHKQNIKLLENLNKSIWIDKSEMTKNQKELNTINFNIDYLDIKRVCGEGGIHSFSKSGVYESNDEYMVYDLDFASYYPHLCFKNNLHPQHIPEELFNQLYEGFYEERKKYPKSNPINYVLKIVLNAAYGLSKDKYSFLYDPKWQLGIVINGQLLLCMLTEWVVDATSYCKIIFENTDGAAFVIKRSEKHLVDEVCKKMEQLSGIALEAQECKKVMMSNVNHYINIINDNNIKYKGLYEIDKDYHKNHSKRIVTIAAAEYLINGKDPSKFIKSYLNDSKIDLIKSWDYVNNKANIYENYGIYDFCIGNKSTKTGGKLHKRFIKGTKVIDTELGKVNRYFVSNVGCSLIKILPPLNKNYLTHTDKESDGQLNIFNFIEDVRVEPKDREENIESGHKCILFNEHFDNNIDDYDINYNYYINETYKLINSMKK